LIDVPEPLAEEILDTQALEKFLAPARTERDVAHHTGFWRSLFFSDQPENALQAFRTLYRTIAMKNTFQGICADPVIAFRLVNRESVISGDSAAEVRASRLNLRCQANDWISLLPDWESINNPNEMLGWFWKHLSVSRFESVSEAIRSLPLEFSPSFSY
jgi:hypothetical protein